MMYSIERILVPIDLSQTSLNALDTAIAIAKRKSARLYLMNVTEPAYESKKKQRNTSDAANYSISNDVLTALIGSIEHAHNIKPDFIQKKGIVYDRVLTAAIEEKIDLIVMGSNGASGFRDDYAGTNTYTVMKYALCPVLSVPPRGTFFDFKKIVFPIRPVSGALASYEIICHFLTAQSTIDILGLSYRNMESGTNVLERIADEIREKAEADKVSLRTVWGIGTTVSEDIMHHLHQHLTDMVVVTDILDVTIKKGFLGPYAQTIINSAKVPVLNIKTVKTGISYS